MTQSVRTLGRYQVLSEIGRGGMAVVYLARHVELGRLVAVKELRVLGSEDPDGVERFVREAQVASTLSHPNIVTVYDFFEVEGLPYIAMEYVEGGSLRPLIGRLTLPQVGGVLEAVLAGLAHGERHGIVHRDLKPENLLVDADGRLKIADFGIAKAINQTTLGRSLTATGMAVGTPEYMAPEQATAAEVGPPTDLYSLGVIGYELLVGSVPFTNADSPMAVLYSHVWDTPPAAKERCPELDDELAEWVMQLLVKEPAERPAGAAQAWSRLEPILVRLGGPLWRQAALLPVSECSTPPDGSLTPAPFSTPAMTRAESGVSPPPRDTALEYVTYQEPQVNVDPLPTRPQTRPVISSVTPPAMLGATATAPPRRVASPPVLPLDSVATEPPTPVSPEVPPPRPPAKPPSDPEPPHRRRFGRGPLAAGLAALVATVVITAVASGVLSGSPAAPPAKPRAPRALSVSEIIARARPAVVQIRGRWGDERVKGTGFVISEKGEILTAGHVVQGLVNITADINSKETIPARIVAQSPCQDIALLQLTRVPPGLSTLKLGDARTALPGALSVALGFPASLQRESSRAVAVGTSGTVAANDLRGLVPSSWQPRLEWAVQTTAPINPGNSGGPLLDRNARVIGMVTLRNETAGGRSAEGQGYAVAANVLAKALPHLRDGTAVDWGFAAVPARKLPIAKWLIAAFADDDINAAWARQVQRDVNQVGGMYITDVTPGSAADRAGLQPGDMIRSLNGTSVRSVSQICDIMLSTSPGDEVSVRGWHLDVPSFAQSGNPFRHRLRAPS